MNCSLNVEMEQCTCHSIVQHCPQMITATIPTIISKLQFLLDAVNNSAINFTLNSVLLDVFLTNRNRIK